jgi:hypothetical protein
MLQKLAEQVADCYRRAREARHKAERAAEGAVRQDYLDLERRWLKLAESYQFTQRVATFQGEMSRRIAVFRPPIPPDPALPRVRCPRCGKAMKLAQIEPALAPGGVDSATFTCVCGNSLEQAAPDRDD